MQISNNQRGCRDPFVFSSWPQLLERPEVGIKPASSRGGSGRPKGCSYLQGMGGHAGWIGQRAERQLGLELILADGSLYPQKGNFSFADRQVDVKTGTLQLEGLFRNPGNILRPGQFACVRR